MASRSYQMSTGWDEHAAQVDPENRLLWRMPRTRMDAETLRDSILSVCGRLDSRMGGEAIPSPAPFQNLTATGVASKAELYQTDRRSVYLPVLRSALLRSVPGLRFPRPGRGQRRSYGDDGRFSGTFHDERAAR